LSDVTNSQEVQETAPKTTLATSNSVGTETGTGARPAPKIIRYISRSMTAVGKLLQKSVFIEGTSCTFKTTILSRLEAEGYPCVTGDFAEHAARHPGPRKQLSDQAMKLVYLTYLYLDHKPYCIIDRTWFATVVYSIVNRSTVDSVASECLDNVYDIPIDVLVILESKPEENLARMQHRGSNIDCNE